MDYFSPHESIKKLEPVLDEYLRWFLQVIAYVFYAEDQNTPPAMPDLFPNWLEEQERSRIIAPAALKRVSQIYDDLSVDASKMLARKQRPGQTEYQHLATLFDEFIKSIRRIEQDSLMDGYGLDKLTGLRSEKNVVKDINEEINRLKRGGRNFCVALVKIDNFDITKIEPGNQEEKKLDLTTQMIKKSVRSFDDAYRLKNGMFVISLKQAELYGGFKALERLKDLLEEKKLQDNQKSSSITLSCCIAQPIKFDEASILIDDLKKFLEDHKNEEGVLLKFYEITPVQQFLNDERGA